MSVGSRPINTAALIQRPIIRRKGRVLDCDWFKVKPGMLVNSIKARRRRRSLLYTVWPAILASTRSRLFSVKGEKSVKRRLTK